MEQVPTEVDPDIAVQFLAALTLNKPSEQLRARLVAEGLSVSVGDGSLPEAASAVVTWARLASYAGLAGRCGTSSRFLGRLPTPFPVSNHE